MAQHILRFLLPWACAGCRTALECLDDTGFCGRCWMAIPRIQGTVCHQCGIPLKDGGQTCYPCRRDPPPLVIRAATEYRGILPLAVYRFKYAGRQSLASPFASLLRYAWDQSPELHQIKGLIPVPLYAKNEKLRGYNQSERLAQAFSRAISRPVVPILIKTRNTHSQVQLDRRKRRENVRRALSLHPTALRHLNVLRGHSFLLIDDVCTTTSTLRECAKTLHRMGIRRVYALVLARDL
jgi:competence protein ComFC